ncbi:MAG: molybdenum cofactor biosynthesis F family protein [Oscillospiraceae bacterium]|nr:molybdenum cofactor biosynthesis F family protein [Oscillospiraceae bacterium]
MFFTKYNPMTGEEVEKKVAEADRASGGNTPADLIGKHFSLKLEGNFAPSQLEYTITDDKNLLVKENGGEYKAFYSSVTLGRMALITHIVPGTSRGWHLVIDTKTRLVTVFETWFGVTVPVGMDLFGKTPPTGYRDIPREVQREYYFGWADFGDGNKPEGLHTNTNRLEGRGYHWSFSNGEEILTFFPSLCSSTGVELGNEMGGITMTNSSDYVRVDDEYYIVTRGEPEMGGKFRVEIIDAFDNKAAGMLLGFTETDEFVYEMHYADLEITGDAAHLEGIFDFGDKARPMANPDKKGARYAYRPMDIDVPMSHEEAIAKADSAQHIFETDGPNIMASKNNLPFSDALVGKSFRIKLDREKYAPAPWTGDGSEIYEYEVISKDILKWRIPGGQWQEEKYICYEPAKNLFFFSHMMTGEPDYANLTNAIDFSNGLATTIKAQIGNWHSEWEIGSQVRFGVLEYGDIKPPFARRHHFTDDLIGRCYSWTYSASMSSIHIYSSPESYSWTIFAKDNSGGGTWSSPCYYIKLREDAYIFQWVEENCNGMQGLVVINPRILHDGGFFYGVGRNGLSLSITGAFGRDLGRFDIKKYFLR